MNFSIKIQPVEKSRVSEVDFDNIPFGKEFSDHMFVADYKNGTWGDFKIVPYGRFTISPANLALHYGQAIFEGMKAGINKEGIPLLFRPEDHSERLNISAHRMGMPSFPKEVFMEALSQLLTMDKNWIPTSEGSALYIRPFMFATDEFLGVKPSESFRLIIFTLPVGPYYTNPVKVVVAQKYMRAVKGGVGYAKAAGNYAATMMPMKLAKAQGFDQILWMSPDFKNVQECGTMNVFFQIGDKFITPTTENGTILAGITRDSFITLLRDKGFTVEERLVPIEEIVEAYHSGDLKDVFGSGTAAVVAPIAHIKYKDLLMELPPVEERKVSRELKTELTGIRNGSIKDPHHWIVPVTVEKGATRTIEV